MNLMADAELDHQHPGEHGIIAGSTMPQIPQAVSEAQDAQHCHQLRIPGRKEDGLAVLGHEELP